MKVELTVSIGLVGCKRSRIFDVPDEDVEGLSKDERAAVIDEIAQDKLWSLVSWNWKEVE
jgi:hypothetical protein